MYWNSLQEFLAMGGYARYVWGAFGVTAVLMAGEMVLAARRLRQARRRARLLAVAGGDA